MNTSIDFTKGNGLLPCIVQDANTGKILMLGYMNEEAYTKTVAERQVTFYSRKKERLWTKGETSGNTLTMVNIVSDCDNDTLLINAIPHGPICHTGNDTCFAEKNDQWNINSLENIIKDRKGNPKEGSYKISLLQSGINKISKKLGEDANELIM
jgi:phosphoribosyl-ATP pyrophosphohydrolase/phosphoribosyl-AMP cyclohydrolase